MSEDLKTEVYELNGVFIERTASGVRMLNVSARESSQTMGQKTPIAAAVGRHILGVLGSRK